MPYTSAYTGAQHDQYATKESLIDLIYPVGAVYISVNSTSPATLFGGTWVQIQDTFLLSAGSTYTGGDNGGSSSHTHTYAHTHTTPATTTDSHTLTLAEAPAHTHGRGTMDITGTIKADPQNAWIRLRGTGAFVASGSEALATGGDSTSTSVNTTLTFTASKTWTGSTDSKGGGGGHTHGQKATTTDSQSTSTTSETSNLPPYLVVYMWKRIS